MAEAKGIKETLEIIAALKEIALTGKAIMKDGKVDLADLGTLMALLNKQATLMAAVSGATDVVEEAKDLSIEETAQICSAVLSAIKAVKVA